MDRLEMRVTVDGKEYGKGIECVFPIDKSKMEDNVKMLLMGLVMLLEGKELIKSCGSLK